MLSLWPPVCQIKGKQWLRIKQADDWQSNSVLCLKWQNPKLRKNISLCLSPSSMVNERHVCRNLHSQVAPQRNFEAAGKLRLRKQTFVMKRCIYCLTLCSTQCLFVFWIGKDIWQSLALGGDILLCASGALFQTRPGQFLLPKHLLNHISLHLEIHPSARCTSGPLHFHHLGKNVLWKSSLKSLCVVPGMASALRISSCTARVSAQCPQ